uniref:DNA-directed DNA polymerase n=1 Tax=Emberiza spodocephala densovirus TaxID=2794496 RepID=A0A8E7G2K1_9VIRU|nr:MAG: DNA polymerase B [Emberiza spodocephala densovirus]
MASFTAEDLEQVKELCAEILEQYTSIKISITILLEWENPTAVDERERIIRTRFVISAFTLDKDEITTEESEVVWWNIEEEIKTKVELTVDQSGLSFKRIVELTVNWLEYRERRSRSAQPEGTYGYARTRSDEMGEETVVAEGRSSTRRGEARLGSVSFVELLYVCSRIARGSTSRNNRAPSREVIESFKAEFGVSVHGNSVANISNIRELCSHLRNIAMVIYNKRGNIIFRHRLEDDEEEMFCANLYWNGEKMIAIKNVNRFLMLHEYRTPVCRECNRAHAVEIECNAPEVSLGTLEKGLPKDDQVIMLTMYADIEAICPSEDRQYACCFSLVACVGNTEVVIKEQLADTSEEKGNGEAEKEVIISLLDAIEEQVRKFHGWQENVPRMYNLVCTWCNQDKQCASMRRVIVQNEDSTRIIQDNVCRACYQNNLIANNYQPIVFFHNFSKYDICFVIRLLVDRYELNIAGKSTQLIYNISCKNKNISLNFKIRDSLHFINGSIQSFGRNVPEQTWSDAGLMNYFELFRGSKGKMPYEWLKTRGQLDSPFPSDEEEDEQINRLNNEVISLTELANFCANNRISTVGTYLQKYCTVDCLLLMFYFNNYRYRMFDEFKIDIAQFYSTPSVSWYLGIRAAPEIGIPTSIKDYLLIKDNIRGGIAQPIERFSEVGEDAIKSIKFLDVNALYSWCMSNKLPSIHINTIEINSSEENTITSWLEKTRNKGDNEIWLLQVDLHYPAELHDIYMHFSFPLAPHHFKQRLCTTFEDKINYLVMDANLEYYLDNGLIVKHIHSIQRWRANYVFKQFVENNITKRNTTTDETLKTVFKTTNNSLFGKTCENVYNYKRFKIASITTDANDDDAPVNQQARDWTNFTIIDEHHVIAQVDIRNVVLNKPIQLGFCILEQAKLRNYKFWKAITQLFSTKAHLLYMDTDSLLIAFEDIDDPFSEIRSHPEMFENGALFDLPLHPEDNTEVKPLKTTGAFSDNCFGRRISAYVGLKAKSYFILFEDGLHKMKTKGIRYSSLHEHRHLNYDDFLDALFNSNEIHVDEYSLNRKNYNIHLKHTYKKALSNLDTKHNYSVNLVIGYPWGYNGEEEINAIFNAS